MASYRLGQLVMFVTGILEMVRGVAGQAKETSKVHAVLYMYQNALIENKITKS